MGMMAAEAVTRLVERLHIEGEWSIVHLLPASAHPRELDGHLAGCTREHRSGVCVMPHTHPDARDRLFDQITWWPGERATEVMDMTEPGGEPRILIRTRIVDGVRGGDEMHARLASINRLAGVSAVWHDPEEEAVFMTAAVAGDIDDARVNAIAEILMIHIAETERLADDIAEFLHGTVHRANHQRSGVREPENRATMATKGYELMASVALFDRNDVTAAASALTAMGCDVTSDADGLTAYVGLDDDGAGGIADTALLTIEKSHHPRYGAGLLMLARMPEAWPPTVAARIAPRIILNWTGAGQFWARGVHGTAKSAVSASFRAHQTSGTSCPRRPRHW